MTRIKIVLEAGFTFFVERDDEKYENDFYSDLLETIENSKENGELVEIQPEEPNMLTPAAFEPHKVIYMQVVG